MVSLEKAINKAVNVAITVGALALVYGGVFYIGNLLDTPEDPVEVPDVNVPDVTDLPNCDQQPLTGEISKFFPTITACDDKKYADFRTIEILREANSPDEISTLSIIENSKKLIVKGEVKDVYLYIKATVEDAEYAPTRKNAVFFIIDGGKYQGYLRASRTNTNELASNSPGIFLSKDIPKIMIEDLTKEIPVSVTKGKTGSTNVNFSEKLSEGSHLIYAYVSKPKFGKISDMSLAYTCLSEGCSIEIQ